MAPFPTSTADTQLTTAHTRSTQSNQLTDLVAGAQDKRRKTQRSNHNSYHSNNRISRNFKFIEITILIIGGTGHTGLTLAKLLNKSGYPILVTSRSGKAPEPFKAVAFDWFNSSTFDAPFQASSDIDRIYIVGPSVLDPLPIVKPFVELAISKGVKRFVLLSASLAPPGGAFAGSVHQYFIDSRKNSSPAYQYVVLRPTSFMQNFVTLYGNEIREKNAIFSTSHGGKVAFVHTDDIAQAAFEALTANTAIHDEMYVVGPQLYSCEEAAQLLSRVIGRKISVVELSLEEHINTLAGFGLPRPYAEQLSLAEHKFGEGVEEDVFNSPPDRKFEGKITLEAFFRDNAAVWA